MKTIPPRKLTAHVSRTLSAKAETDDFVSGNMDALEVTYEGIVGDYHAGLTRSSGAREPWYKEGTEMRNERQISILSEEELTEIANTMGIDEVDPGWIGGNLVLEGIPDMSYLPPRTLLIFDGGVTLRVDGYNAPCKYAGAEIARGLGEEAVELKNTDTALNFVKAADKKRGLVAWVEREGKIQAGEGVTVRIWEQWLYE